MRTVGDYQPSFSKDKWELYFVIIIPLMVVLVVFHVCSSDLRIAVALKTSSKEYTSPSHKKDDGKRRADERSCISVGNELYNGMGIMSPSLSRQVVQAIESIKEVTPDATMMSYSETSGCALNCLLKSLASPVRRGGDAAGP